MIDYGSSSPGFQRINELTGIAWRHSNVFNGIVAVRPKYLRVPHSGYEPLL